MPFRHRHRGEDVGCGVGPHDQVDTVLGDQLFVQFGDTGSVGGVVDEVPLDRSAQEATGIVEPIDES
jgi:hypothetical protein